MCRRGVSYFGTNVLSSLAWIFSGDAGNRSFFMDTAPRNWFPALDFSDVELRAVSCFGEKKWNDQSIFQEASNSRNRFV
jgi:hypothetical protein